jgi:hypothetical protein
VKILQGIITALTLPLALFNMLAGVVAGIWLAILGEWGTIGHGILFFFVSTFSLSLVLLPSMLLSAPAAYCAEKGKTFGMLCFSALSNIYTLAVITIWCCGILYMFVKDANASTLIPKLIWSYGIATGPWSYMASKEQQGGDAFASLLATFLAELAYVVIILMIIFTTITPFQVIKVFAGFMLIGLLIQMTVAYLLHKEMKELSY